MNAAPALTNLDRVLWPRDGLTKGGMLEYYRAVAPVLLPHLAGRPLTLRRFPEGVEGPSWYQTNCRGAPPWMRIATVAGRRGGTFSMCVVDDLPALLWVANLGTIELHPHPGTAAAPGRPTWLVFDLDPGEGAGLLQCSEVALIVRARLASSGLASVVKTSGSLGLHVYAAIEPTDDTRTKAFARAIAEELAAERPELVVATADRGRRARRVYLDWLQNDATRSTVAPYSLRALPWPLVSAPLVWPEVERAVETGDARPLVVDHRGVIARVAELGDPFAPVLGPAPALLA
jgi:bifunctional non-homologous end joining protein LigD